MLLSERIRTKSRTIYNLTVIQKYNSGMAFWIMLSNYNRNYTIKLAILIIQHSLVDTNGVPLSVNSLHNTVISLIVQVGSHNLPQTLAAHNSTHPCRGVAPPTSLTSPLVHCDSHTTPTSSECTQLCIVEC